MNLWHDGRSGPAGCLAGNLVLSHLRDSQGEEFSERKGTTFFGRGAIWVGRICSTDSYLFGRDRHWANLSLEQHREVTEQAMLAGQTVKYLFITALAGEPAIHIWVLPGALIERVAFSDPKQGDDYVYSLHIREDDDRFILEREDVTKYHHVLALNATMAPRLERAFEATKQARERRQVKRANRVPPSYGAFEESRPDYARRGEFSIPLKGGRSARLHIPLPAADADLNRIKGWIDLMNDVLTESIDADEAHVDQRRSAAVNAIERLHRASEARGLDQISEQEMQNEICQARLDRP